MEDIVEVIKATIAYGILLFVLHVWCYIVVMVCQFIAEEVIPFIKHFIKPTSKED